MVQWQVQLAITLAILMVLMLVGVVYRVRAKLDLLDASALIFGCFGAAGFGLVVAFIDFPSLQFVLEAFRHSTLTVAWTSDKHIFVSEVAKQDLANVIVADVLA